MNRILKFGMNYCSYSISNIKIRKYGTEEYLKRKRIYARRALLTAAETNNFLIEKLSGNDPFMAGRFGANELSTVKTFDFEVKSRYEKLMTQLVNCAGFFPSDVRSVKKFKDLMLDSIGSVDLLGVWALPFEEYYLSRYADEKSAVTYLPYLRPWEVQNKPWTQVLEHKKVLVIHPFTDTIKKQYEHREHLFQGTNILPEFDLLTLRAVQTIAGQKDERFSTWFEALDWMFQEAVKAEFDIAIIGCGAYGFPLAAKLKRSGKKVIHLGGATQLLFGIRGKRWDENPSEGKIRRFYNSYWVRPSEEERPVHSEIVEGSCYW